MLLSSEIYFPIMHDALFPHNASLYSFYSNTKKMKKRKETNKKEDKEQKNSVQFSAVLFYGMNNNYWICDNNSTFI